MFKLWVYWPAGMPQEGFCVQLFGLGACWHGPGPWAPGLLADLCTCEISVYNNTFGVVGFSSIDTVSLLVAAHMFREFNFSIYLAGT